MFSGSDKLYQPPLQNKDEILNKLQNIKKHIQEGKETSSNTDWIWGIPENHEYDDYLIYEFRISIVPEKDNLITAYEALIDIFERYQVKFKLMWLDDSNRANWDPTIPYGKAPPESIENLSESDTDSDTDTDTDSKINSSTELGYDKDNPSEFINFLYRYPTDRSQTGKEACIYFVPARDTADPEHWKNLMLECWQRLAVEGVKLGYAQPHGDAPIRTENGDITPFSYNQVLDWKRRHGTLSGQPTLQPNQTPFPSIQITQADLTRYAIGEKKIERLREKRLTYYQNKKQSVEHSLGQIKQLMNNLPKENVETDIEALEAIITELKNSDSKANFADLKEPLKQLYQRLPKNFPRVANYDSELKSGSELAQAPALHECFSACFRLIHAREKKNDDDANTEIKSAQANLAILKAFYLNETVDTFEDFYYTPLVRNWLTQESFHFNFWPSMGQINLEMIKRHPFLMQAIFRKIVHCCRELQIIEYFTQRHHLENNLKALINHAHALNPGREKSKLEAAIRNIRLLLKQVETAKNQTGDYQTAISILRSTNIILTAPNEQNLAAHYALANTLKEKPKWRGIAAAMGIIGFALIAAGVFISVGTLGIGTIVPVCIASAIAYSTGSALLLAGIGTFAYGRRKEISKTTYNIAEDQQALDLAGKIQLKLDG